MEMNIAELIRESIRLDEYTDAHDDDDASDRMDNVRDAIDEAIYERNHVITITKWIRPILNHGNLEKVVSGLPTETDKALVRKFVEQRYTTAYKGYEWFLNGTFTPREPLKCVAVVKKLEDHGLEAVWEKEPNSDGRWIIANPTYSQCFEMYSDNGKKNGGVDLLWLTANHDDTSLEQDEYSSARRNIDRRLLEFTFGKPAVSSYIHVDLVPLIQELFGDKLASGEEALRLMSPEGLDYWKFHYLGWGNYEPQVEEETTLESAL
jgi:hypothetical protein